MNDLLSTRPIAGLRGVALHASMATLAALVLALACGGPEAPESSGPQQIEGVYRVEGITTEVASGFTRPLTGLLVVRQEGDRYTTNFDLSSEVPARGKYADESMSIEIVGEGEGLIEGDKLVGSARTQLLRSVVPGIHASFGMVPREVGARIVSTTQGHIGPDRELTIEIETGPEGDADYAPTRTRLVGHRVGEVGEAPALPNVASPPPQ